GLASLYDEMVRHAADERDAIHLVMAMEPWVAKSGTSAEHLSTIDVALKRYPEAVPARVSRLLAVKARLLATDPNRADDAARLFRSLIAAASSENAPALVESFDAFLKQTAPTEGRHHPHACALEECIARASHRDVEPGERTCRDAGPCSGDLADLGRCSGRRPGAREPSARLVRAPHLPAGRRPAGGARIRGSGRRG